MDVLSRFPYLQCRWSVVLVWTFAFALACLALHAQAQERIDPLTGQLLVTATDITLTVEPVTLELRRSLIARANPPGLFGSRWQSNWESRVVPTPTAIVIDQLPHPVAFTREGGATEYRSAFGDRLVTQADGRFVRTMHNGTTETYDAQGRLIERDYRNGNKAIVRYGADGRIARVDGPKASFIQFSADDQGRVTRVESSTGAAVRYGYTGGNLNEVQVNGGPVLRYAYDTRGALTRIDRPMTGAVEIGYDAHERVVNRRWADGAEERFEYDDKTNAQRRTGPSGAVTLTQWSADGRHVQVTDPRGGKIVIAFDAGWRPVSITDQIGARTTIVYDALGRAVAVHDAQGQVTRYQYVGATSRVSAITRADGTQESFAYDAQQNPTEIKIGAQTLASNTYNADGTVSAAKGPGIPQQRFSYDAQGRLNAAVDALGNPLQIGYDARGNPVAATDALGGVRRWQWNAHDQLVSDTDPSGAITRYEYDATGRLARIINPLGGTTRFEYDARGRRIAKTDPAGLQSRYEYDRAGRLSKITTAGVSESFRYDAAGNLIEWTDPLGRSIQMDYDALGRITHERWSSGLQIHYRYDANGQLAAIENSGGRKLEWQHDARGRVIAQRDALGAVTQFQYDALGNITARRDPLGHVKQFTYDVDGALARVQEPSGDAAAYHYDAAQRLVELTRPSGGKSRFTYNGLGQLTKEVDPLGHERRYEYDVAGRLIASTDAMGRAAHYAYDAAGRLVEKRFADGKRVAFKYDAIGNLLEADDGAFPVRHTYDVTGRRIKTEYPAIKKAVAYEYDPAGLRTKLSASDGRVTRYEYDTQKQLSAIVSPDGKRIALTYDAEQRLQSIAYPNGTTGTWQYDSAGRVTRLVYANAAGQAIAAWTYSYDRDGNLVSQQTADGRSTSYKYDPAGQLTELLGAAGAVRYRYGPGGARASMEAGATVVKYRHDAADRLLESGSDKLTYDANGNLIRREGPSGTTSYEYDTEDRLVKVQTSDGKTVTFGYAPTGERVWKRDSGGVTYYIYDGIDLIQEIDDKGNAKVAYAHGPGIDQPLAMLREGKSYYYHADRLGSTRALTDERGDVVAAYDYDAHGTIETARGTLANPFTFTGREWDASTRLYYYRARYYDATLGRFLSPDPRSPRLKEPLEHNPYLYVRNQPLRFVDPMGLAEDNPYAEASTDELVQRKGILDDKKWRVIRGGMRNVERTELEEFGRGKPDFDRARQRRLDRMGSKIDAARQPIQTELNRRGYVPPPPKPAELSPAEQAWMNNWTKNVLDPALAADAEAAAAAEAQAATRAELAASGRGRTPTLTNVPAGGGAARAGTAQVPRPLVPAETGVAVAEAEAGAALTASEAGAAARLKGFLPSKGTVGNTIAGVLIFPAANAIRAGAEAEPGKALEAAGNSLADSGRGLVEAAPKIGGCALGGAVVGACFGGPPGAAIGAKIGATLPLVGDMAKAGSDALQPYVDNLKQLYPEPLPPGQEPRPTPGLTGSVTGGLPTGSSQENPGGAGLPPELVDLSGIPVDPNWQPPHGEFNPRRPGLPRGTPEQTARAGGFSGGAPTPSSPGGGRSSGAGAPQSPGYTDPASGSAPGASGGATPGAPGILGPGAAIPVCRDAFGNAAACPPTVFPPGYGYDPRRGPGVRTPWNSLPQGGSRPGGPGTPTHPGGGTTTGGMTPSAPGAPTGGTTPSGPAAPPTVVAQNPRTPGTTPGTTKTSGGKCTQPVCYRAGQTDCINAGEAQTPRWIAACIRNMEARCNQGNAGGTGQWCVRDKNCAARAKRVCEEGVIVFQ